MDPTKDLAAYGYGSVAWKERVDSWKLRQEKMQMMTMEGGQQLTGGKGGDFDDPNGPDLPMWVWSLAYWEIKLISPFAISTHEVSHIHRKEDLWTVI